MAESLPFGQSIDIGSDQVKENYCEPCFEIDSEVKEVAGYCQDCSESLCVDCFTTHRGPKLFRNHRLVDKSTKPKRKSTPKAKPQNSTECYLHHGESIQAFCQHHSQLCCKVCIKINHQACNTEVLSKLSRNIKDSKELINLNKKLDKLKEGFDDSLTKTGANELVIQRNHREAGNDMNKLQDEFDKLMAETKNQADKVRVEDFEKIENISETCNVVIEQINKMVLNIDTLGHKGENDKLFISMKRAESQIESLEESLEQLNKNNTVREYQFEPEDKLKALFSELKVLGHLSFNSPSTADIDSSEEATCNVNISDQKAKRPVHIKDINVKSSSDKDFAIFGSIAIPNNQVLITDWYNKKVKLIDTIQNKILSEIKLPCEPCDVTKVNQNEYAVTLTGQQQIQFLSVTQQSLFLDRQISVNGQCRGLAYNSRDKTLIVTYAWPSKVEILDMSGTVIRIMEKYTNRSRICLSPIYVALSPSLREMYVSNDSNHNVTLMTLNGDVKTEFMDSGMKSPGGVCVAKSGLVYVVGRDSHTVHQLNPDSGEFKLLLDQKDGIDAPRSISYCDLEHKLYIGMARSSFLKVFKLK